MVSGVSRTAPATLLALFLLLSGVPLLALGWLGWRVLEQDHALENQRERERLENAANLIARELDTKLSDWEQLLVAAARGESIAVPADGVLVLIGPDGVAVRQGTPLPYYPRVPSTPSVPSELFAVGDALEFHDENLVASLASYRQLASSTDDAIRGEALVRIARCLRKLRRNTEALQAYDRLAAIRTASVAGSPAELVARRERIALLMDNGDTEGVARERRLLASALAAGRYPIDRATFEFFSEFASPIDGDRGPRQLASAIEVLWPSWLEQPSGRVAVVTSVGAFVTIWRKASAVAALAAPFGALAPTLEHAGRTLHVAVQLEDRAGKALWGTVDDTAQVSKAPRETGLPWLLRVSDDRSSAPAIVDSRRGLFAAGFALMGLVIAAASYFVFRAVTRELRVAQLQSDFVAAVSHEFRTPLTAMCHLTDMLEHGDTSTDRLPEYYRALGKESRRLHAMVENLLDFGRMESGRRTYDLHQTDVVDLVDHVAQEYADRAPGAASRIEKPRPGRAPVYVRADPEALALAVRNLLDNAMKYSPASSPVRVEVAAQNGTVAVHVADRGAGIGAQERGEIFRKFTRGAAARTLNVKGTGIGLTMANQIVKAHGGRLELQSEPGSGSTFTIVLPAAP